MITSIKGLEYGGKYSKYFWDINNNPLASVKNCLPNCTCFVIGDVLSDGLPKPVDPVRNANQWHLFLTNGWTLLDFNREYVQTGDILEWTNGCHVARVSHIEDNGTIYISGSFYTGIHGKAMYKGEFDTRDGLNSMQEVSDFMLTNYPTRFFHFWTLENENKWIGGEPRYILRAPKVLEPVERDESKNQIEVLTNEQNIRNSENEIVGVAQKGYYNVLRITHSSKNDKDWYEVADDKYICQIDNRVVYLPTNLSEVERLREENKKMRRDMQEIYKIIERWL